MKIYTYDNDVRNKTVYEISEEEFAPMIEADYQERLAKAKPGVVVKRRTPQEILDKEISNPSYRNEKQAQRKSL